MSPWGSVPRPRDRHAMRLKHKSLQRESCTWIVTEVSNPAGRSHTGALDFWVLANWQAFTLESYVPQLVAVKLLSWLWSGRKLWFQNSWSKAHLSPWLAHLWEKGPLRNGKCVGPHSFSSFWNLHIRTFLFIMYPGAPLLWQTSSFDAVLISGGWTVAVPLSFDISMYQEQEKSQTKIEIYSPWKYLMEKKEKLKAHSTCLTV